MRSRAELLALQSLPLDIKVEKSLARIREWHDHWDGLVYVAFSGGKDSLVLKNLVESVYGDEVPSVYINTGLDYPEVRSFAMSKPNVTRIDPRVRFAEVVERFGYPMVSKEQAKNIYEYRHARTESNRRAHWDGVGPNKQGKISDRWRFLVNAPFSVSHRCCDYLKREPAKKYEKETGRHPFTGILASESRARTSRWVFYGCNAYETSRPTSAPLSIWTEQDILRYALDNGLELAPPYGKIVEGEDGKLRMTGDADRTGCTLCGFGVHGEPQPNRFQRLAVSHPPIWEYGMKKLGIGAVCDYMGIPWKPIEIKKRNEE